MYILLSGNPVFAVVAIAVIAAASISGGYRAADAKILVGPIWLWPQTMPLTLLNMIVFGLSWRNYRQGNFAPLVVAILRG